MIIVEHLLILNQLTMNNLLGLVVPEIRAQVQRLVVIVEEKSGKQAGRLPRHREIQREVRERRRLGPLGIVQ